MGRDKRIAESRAKEILDKTKGGPEPRRTGAGGGSAPAPAAAAIPEIEQHTGTGKALIQIVALYAVPVILMVIIGRLLLHM